MKKEEVEALLEEFELLGKASRESFEMITKLENERMKIIEIVKKEPESEELHRIAIRTIFSIIEGLCNSMKEAAFFLAKTTNVDFRKEEIAIINEESFYLADNGEAKIKRPNIKTSSNLRFAFKIFARAARSDFELDVEKDKGWEEFQEALNIRNRITHPRRTKDLTISKDDFDKVTRVYGWVITSKNQLLKHAKFERSKKEQ